MILKANFPLPLELLVAPSSEDVENTEDDVLPNKELLLFESGEMDPFAVDCIWVKFVELPMIFCCSGINISLLVSSSWWGCEIFSKGGRLEDLESVSLLVPFITVLPNDPGYDLPWTAELLIFSIFGLPLLLSSPIVNIDIQVE